MVNQKRLKLMKSINLTEDALNKMLMSQDSTAKLMFESCELEGEIQLKIANNAKSQATYKEILNYVEIS
jgi:hypothetical protein